MFGKMLFPESQNVKTSYGLDPNEFPGIKHIARLLDTVEDNKDIWLVYEVGSYSLSKHLFDVKGEFFKGERLYHVRHQPFYQALKMNKNLLRLLIKKMAEIFDVLSACNIVHADIKPDNILVSFDEQSQSITDIKLIDFGSAFAFDQPSSI